MQSEKSVIQWNCCRRKQQIEGRLHMRSALPDDESQIHEARFLPGAVVSGFFTSVLSVVDSDTMRHVDGGVLNNPVTRASQSGGGGRIPRAGRLKKSRITQRRLAPYEGQSKRRANFDLDHGKATLCSSIHHRGHQNAK